MATVVTRNFTDCSIRQANPDTNYEKNGLGWVRGGSTQQARTLLYTPRPFRVGATILSATLRVTTNDVLTGSTTLSLARFTSKFEASKATWNNSNSLGVAAGAVTSTKATTPAGAVWEFDVTAHMQAIADGAAWRGWRLSTTRDAYQRVRTSDAQGEDMRPVLTVTWSDKPDVPTDLSPGGGRVVSLEKPLLRFTFADYGGDRTLGQVRVQIKTDVATPTIDFDSGWVAQTEPEFDLAGTAFTWPNGADRVWRVSVRDGAGLESGWSPWAAMSRRAKATVTVTTPVNDSVTEEPRPVVRWTLTGGPATPQVAYMIQIYNDNDNDDKGTELWSSGKVSSTTARVLRLPAGVIKTDNRWYRVRVVTWDSFNRESIPGDLNFSFAFNRFRFDRDGSLIQVTGLTATPTTDKVGMVLTWNRASAPSDGWVIVRDGEVVAEFDTASDLGTGGNSYAWTDWTARPRFDHVWEVCPVIEGIAGKSFPVTGRLETEGLWLVRTDNGHRTCFFDEDIDFSLGEQVTVQYPLESRVPVKITQGLRGYEGPVSGILTDGFGRTAQVARQRLLQFRARPNMTLRLVAADHNFPVKIWGVSSTPAPAGSSLRYAARFQFAQVGEFDIDPGV